MFSSYSWAVLSAVESCVSSKWQTRCKAGTQSHGSAACALRWRIARLPKGKDNEEGFDLGTEFGKKGRWPEGGGVRRHAGVDHCGVYRRHHDAGNERQSNVHHGRQRHRQRELETLPAIENTNGKPRLSPP